jgi:hypothetical protein
MRNPKFADAFIWISLSAIICTMGYWSTTPIIGPILWMGFVLGTLFTVCFIEIFK